MNLPKKHERDSVAFLYSIAGFALARETFDDLADVSLSHYELA